MEFAVTTVRNNTCRFIKTAQSWAEKLQVSYIPRRQYNTLEELLEKEKLTAVLVASADGPQIFTPQGVFFFHPSMSALRIKRLKNGENDNFAEALGIKPGMKILDATLGLGSDAAIASYLTGAGGEVVGIEASPLLAFTVQNGLQEYVAKDDELTDAMRRIHVHCDNAENYLASCAEDAFDVVYFDPMFRYPVNGSSAIAALRPVAYEKPLSAACIELALKAAPKVVIKERTENILREYGCSEISGGRYSKVKYGIIRREKKDER